MVGESVIHKYLFGLVIFILGAFIIYALMEFFAAFLGAIVFYILFKDFMYKLITKRGMNKSLAAVLIIAISFVIVLLPIGFLVIMLYNKVAPFLENPSLIKTYMDQVTHSLDGRLPVKSLTDNLGENTVSFVTSHASVVLNSSLNMLAALLMMYFLLYFLLVNTRIMEAKILLYLPLKKSTILLFGQELEGQTMSNAIGVPAVGIAQGLLSWLAYYIAGVPDAGTWAILTGFASIVPLVGTAIIWIPVSIYVFAGGHIWQGGFVIIFCAVVLANIDNLIRMGISKRIGDVHPVITVLGVILGLKFFSLPGLVFGPLLISYFIILLKLFNVEYSGEDGTVEAEAKASSSISLTLFKKLLDALNTQQKIKKP